MNKKLFTIFSILIIYITSFSFAQKKLTIKDQNIYAEYSDLSSSVNLYYEHENDKKTAVLNLNEYGKSTFVGFMLDNQFFNLKESASVSYKAYTNENTLTVEYLIKNKIKFIIDYSILEKNILQINYTVSNIDSKAHNIAFKSVFDTVLGERYKTAFSSSINSKINSEYIISDFNKHKQLISTDGKIRIAFILDDQLQKDAYKVVVAAKPYLSESELKTHFIEGRGFNTVLSYNNSCVGFFFKSGVLNNNSKKTFTQKIYFESNLFLQINDGKSKDEIFEADEFEDAIKINQEAKKDESFVKPNQQEVQKTKTEDVQNQKTEKKQNTSKENPVQEKESSRITQTDLSKEKERAKKLIERIQQIEDDGSDSSREEVMRLQIELNGLMKKLK